MSARSGSDSGFGKRWQIISDTGIGIHVLAFRHTFTTIATTRITEMMSVNCHGNEIRYALAFLHSSHNIPHIGLVHFEGEIGFCDTRRRLAKVLIEKLDMLWRVGAARIKTCTVRKEVTQIMILWQT